MLKFGGLESIDMRSLWHTDNMVRSGAALGAALLLLAFFVYATIALGSTDVGSVLHDVSPGPGDGQNSQPWLIIGASAVAILVGLAVTLAARFLPKSTPSRPTQ